MPKIAIIENYFVARTGVRYLLDISIPDTEFMETTHADFNLDKMKSFHPDVIIVGLNSHDHTKGSYLRKDIRQTFNKFPIIIYTDQTDHVNAAQFMKDSVNGYLSKSDNEVELLSCLKIVLTGKKYVCPDVQDNLIKHFFNETHNYSNYETLSIRESEIAMHLVEGKRTSEIATYLGLKASTISTVKSRIYAKLDVSNIIDLRQSLLQSKSPNIRAIGKKL